MSSIRRRHFLQGAGSTAAFWGLSQSRIVKQGNIYGQALAQNTSRKLALLIGINQYQSPAWDNLKGCLTDVDLQKELLVHRFGFNERDIVTLTDAQATRNQILTAFQEHLLNQEKGEHDIVVIHFSGHGDLVRDPEPISQSGCNGSLVTVEGQPSKSGTVPYIMGRSIFLLMMALKSQNITFILDSCFSGAGTRGNLRIRSINSGTCYEPATEELEFQRKLLSQINLSPGEFQRRRQRGAAKGVVLASTQPMQLAADLPFDDGAFHAGLFTYFLTQSLWDSTNNLTFDEIVRLTSERMKRFSFFRQDPLIDANPIDNRRKNFYFTTQQFTPAEAVVTQTEDNRVELWLGGVSPEALTTFRQGTVLSAFDGNNSQRRSVRIISRSGLQAVGELVDTPLPIEAGIVLQEEIRQLPQPGELTLRIGIDASLDDEPLTSELLQQINRVEVRTLQESEVDYIIGRATVTYQQESLDRIAINSIGLFLPSFHPVASTFGNSNESISDAINRLDSSFDTLLSTRVLRTVANSRTSRLKVKATMLAEGTEAQLAYLGRDSEQLSSVSELLLVPSGSMVSFQVENQEDLPIYIYAFAIDSSQVTIFIYPTTLRSVSQVFPSEQVVIPTAEDHLQLRVLGVGDLEIFMIASTYPLKFEPSQSLRLDISTAEEILLQLNRELGADISQYTALSVKFSAG